MSLWNRYVGLVGWRMFPQVDDAVVMFALSVGDVTLLRITSRTCVGRGHVLSFCLRVFKMLRSHLIRKLVKQVSVVVLFPHFAKYDSCDGPKMRLVGKILHRFVQNTNLLSCHFSSCL